jgi:hypothetical protein
MKHTLTPVLVILLLQTSGFAQDPKVHAPSKGAVRIDGEIALADEPMKFLLDPSGKQAPRKMRAKLYDIELLAGKRYTFTLDAAKKGLDSFLVLQDGDGKTVAFDDDSGGSLNARLVFEATREGRYRVAAGALNGSGPFTLRIAEANIVRQGFPAAKALSTDLATADTAWEIEWDITNPDNGGGKRTLPSSVLAIRSAKFMFKDHAGRARWLTVLQNLEVGEILVPYDKMQPVFLDVSEHAFHLLPAKKEYLGPNCVLPGEILDSSDSRMKNRVLKEVHDDGLRWVSGREKTRRGEKMLLWALFHGGNYRYILEYGFSDDGVISCRLGASAHNFFDRRKDGGDAHLHVGCWRWDPELREAGEPGGPTVGGATHNRVLLVRRVPRTAAPNGMFKVDIAPFNANEEGQASEGFADWKAEEFTILRVQSLVRKNSSKDPQPTAYDLVPLRLGSVRNFPWKYHFANHDFWVTQRRSDQTKFREVPLYATQSRPLEKNAVTIWHSSASYHVPRAEDYGPDGFSRNSGVATTSWAGFLLRPINLFDGTPLYP